MSTTIPLSPSARGNHEWTAKNKSTISRSHKSVHSADSLQDKTRCHYICDLCGKLPMLHPFGTFRCSWDVIIMLMLIYTSLEVPFTLGFGIDLALKGQYQKFGIIALIIDIFLLCDICLNFRTAFFDKYDDLRLITNPTRIAFRYFKGWFVLDLITSFPFEFLLPDNGEEDESNGGNNFTSYLKILRIFRLFRIFKILRLLKMVKLFDGFVSHIIAREALMVIRMFKILCFSLLSAHFCACFWYYIGCESHLRYEESWIASNGLFASHCGIGSDGENSTLFLQYTFSWYWSVVTLFTTGYGDVIPTSPYEQWSASLVILIGTCLFGYFVGTITSLITEGDRVTSTIVNKLEDAQHFCQQKKLPAKMSRAVLTHTRYHCNHNYVLGDENDVLSNLPSYLAMDVSLYISDKYLEHLDFFANKYVDPYVRGLIAMKMKSISCNKGFKLFVKGDVAEKIYIQRVGTASHIIYDKTNSNTYKEKTKRGDVVGEYAFILKKRDSTLICQTWCEFYVLDVNDILEIFQQHYGQNWTKKLCKMKRFIKQEYSKPFKKRKKRHCLIKNNPLLPSFTEGADNGDDDNQNNETDDDNDDEEGQQGHCDWGNQDEIKEAKDLEHLETLTEEVLKANAKDDIKIGLNALSKHAYEITKLTNDSNKSLIQYRIANPLSSASTMTMHKTKTMLRGLMREDSFMRDLEVAKSYNAGWDDSNSSDDDEKYNDELRKQHVEEEEDEEDNHTASVKKKGKTNTMEVADHILEMMTVHITKLNDVDHDDEKRMNQDNDNKENGDKENGDNDNKGNGDKENDDNDNKEDGDKENDDAEKMNNYKDDDDDGDGNIDEEEEGDVGDNENEIGFIDKANSDESRNTDSVGMSDDESRNTDTFSEKDNLYENENENKNKKQKKGKGKGNGKKKKKKFHKNNR